MTIGFLPDQSYDQSCINNSNQRYDQAMTNAVNITGTA